MMLSLPLFLPRAPEQALGHPRGQVDPGALGGVSELPHVVLGDADAEGRLLALARRLASLDALGHEPNLFRLFCDYNGGQPRPEQSISVVPMYYVRAHGERR